MLRQNMPAPTTKWQALFEGAEISSPVVMRPMKPALGRLAQNDTVHTAPLVTISAPEPTGAEIALTVGVGLVGTVIGAFISYGICCWAMKNCG